MLIPTVTPMAVNLHSTVLVAVSCAAFVLIVRLIEATVTSVFWLTLVYLCYQVPMNKRYYSINI